MREISIKFDYECPHCNAMNGVEAVSYGEIEGSVLSMCTRCAKQAVIAWSLEVEADVYKCESDAADVECNFSLSDGEVEE